MTVRDVLTFQGISLPKIWESHVTVGDMGIFPTSIQQHNGLSVMSSIDLAEMCVGEAKDAHSDFMKKAKKVLGEGIGNFSDTYVHPQNGQTYKSLLLPERESCLMAMSYSYELQAKVYDAWLSLRNPVAMTPMEMIATIATTVAAQEKSLAVVTDKVDTPNFSGLIL